MLFLLFTIIFRWKTFNKLHNHPTTLQKTLKIYQKRLTNLTAKNKSLLLLGDVIQWIRQIDKIYLLKKSKLVIPILGDMIKCIRRIDKIMWLKKSKLGVLILGVSILGVLIVTPSSTCFQLIFSVGSKLATSVGEQMFEISSSFCIIEGCQTMQTMERDKKVKISCVMTCFGCFSMLCT